MSFTMLHDWYFYCMHHFVINFYRMLSTDKIEYTAIYLGRIATPQLTAATSSKIYRIFERFNLQIF